MFDQDLLTRRQALRKTACGFGGLALAGMLADTATATEINPLAPRMPHFQPRAKRVIFIFMQGGPSQVDTFTYKPMLERRHGEQLSFDDARAIAKDRCARNITNCDEVAVEVQAIRRVRDTGHPICSRRRQNTPTSCA